MTNINHNYARLLEAMDFTPEKWEVVGVQERNTAPKCSCGHDIIYNYPMKHKETGKIIPIGSVCIEHAPFIPAHLVSQYKEIIKRIKEEQRQAKLLQQEAIKGELEANFKKNYELIKDINTYKYTMAKTIPGPKLYPDSVYTEEGYNFIKELNTLMFISYKLPKKKLKTARGWIKCYTQLTEKMKVFNDKWKVFKIIYG